MNPLTRYRLSRALKEISPEQPKESRLKSIFIKIFKFFKFVGWKLSVLGFISNWLNKQAFGVVVTLFTAIVFIAIIIANQLRYYYWENIMRTNYPNEVLVVVDKVLFEFNAVNVTLHYFIYTLLIGIILVHFNRKYCSAKPQSIPRVRR